MNYSKYISETAADLVTNTKPIFFLEFLSDAISKAQKYEHTQEGDEASLTSFLIVHLNYFGISWLKCKDPKEAKEDLCFAMEEICSTWTPAEYYKLLSYALRAFGLANPDRRDQTSEWDKGCESCIDALFKIAKVIELHPKAAQETA